MTKRIELMMAGFDLVERIDDPKAKLPCYLCSPDSPKFQKGWRVRVHQSGSTVLVGHECAKRHLGVDFTQAVRLFDQAELASRMSQWRAKILETREAIETAASCTISDTGLAAIAKIKQGLLELDSRARKTLDQAAANTFAGIGGLEAFGHRTPVSDARDVISLLSLVVDCDDPPTLLKHQLALRKKADDHNRLVQAYGKGTSGLNRANLARLNDKTSTVTFSIDGTEIVMRRTFGDRLEYRLPIPAPLELRIIEVPR